MLHPTALHVEISSPKNSLQFYAFSLPKKFLQATSKAFQAIPSVKYKSVLKFWSSNCCVIAGRRKIPSFFLASLILVRFCFNRKTLRFLYLCIVFTDLTNHAEYALEVNIFLTYPLKKDVPHSADKVLFLNGVYIFYPVKSAPRSAVPFTLKAAEFSVSSLKHSLNCCNV